MFVIDSKKWRCEYATCQERLLVEAWLESLASDTSPLFWPPVCSTFQTLRNFMTTLQEVERDILFAYHVRLLADESLDRLSDCEWLKSGYSDDLVVVRDLLARLRDIHKMDENLGNEENRSRKVNQGEARKTALSFFRAFLPKIERDGLIGVQVDHIKRLTADMTTSFDVLCRAVGEFANDLVHLGHSREHLHGWMLGALLKPVATNQNQSFLDRFDTARNLGQRMAGGCDVLFMVAAPANVPDSDNIRFLDKLPVDFPLVAGSPFLKSRKRFAIVNVECNLDRRAATEQAYRELLRYLHSTRLDHIDFDRSVVRRAAVRVASGNTYEVAGSWRLPHCELHNDDLFYAMSKTGRNESTFAELDRVLYWLEQARRWDDVGQLIALWTALEFLFSKTIQPAPESIQNLMPAYLVPNYARLLLVDFWAFIEHVPAIKLPAEMETRLEVQATGIGTRRKVNLLKLLEECLKDDATNPLKAIIAEYPLLMRKYHRLRLLDPTPRQDMPIRRCLSRFEREITFDLQFAFRARNTIVHDAAIQIVQLDRLIQRLNWMLSTALDTLLFQFVQNPTVSLNDLHEINRLNFAKWKQRFKDKVPVPLAEVVEPPQPGLSGKR